MSEQGLPHNIDTERSLLGGALLAESVILAEIREVLAPRDFFAPRHQMLFETILRLADSGITPDVTTVLDDLMLRHDLERHGGVAYITALPQACSSVENLGAYALRVKEHSQRRHLLLAARKIEEDVQAGVKDLAELMDGAEREVFSITAMSGSQDWYTVEAIAAENLLELTKRSNNPGVVTGIPTGFADLDHKLAGLHRTDFIVIAARPAMGKTAFVLNMMVNAAIAEDICVGMFSLEMSRHQLVMRMVAGQSRVDAGRMRTGQLDVEDWRRLGEGTDVIASLPILIDDTPGLTISQLRGKARRMKAAYPKLGMIVVDYIQLMQGSGGAKESRENVISNISRGLKMLAKELNIPVIGLSQLNRSLESRTDKRPMPSDLRESGAIEQDADIILFIYRDEVYNKEASAKKGVAEIIIAKQRSGPIGTVELAFLDKYVLFQNLGTASAAGSYY
jgi:replicative DNA helicase